MKLLLGLAVVVLLLSACSAQASAPAVPDDRPCGYDGSGAEHCIDDSAYVTNVSAFVGGEESGNMCFIAAEQVLMAYDCDREGCQIAEQGVIPCYTVYRVPWSYLRIRE